jgi:hypothetical protein
MAENSVNVNNQDITDKWAIYNTDCCKGVQGLDEDSIDFSVYSPPFASLYTYSDLPEDLGNCENHDAFFEHYSFLINEIYRVTKPGRLTSVHCMNLPTSKVRDGYIGIVDFRGEVIRKHIEAGFIFHSEVCIWKNPVVAMQRTKALGLLHKQVKKDSCMSRQGIPDYVCTFRKPGENPNPVTGELDTWAGDDSFVSNGNLSIDLWQQYASPVWMDINQSNTLQKDSAREDKDERHICPLQLDVIERCLHLWSNKGDVVLSPFMGIGSEGFVSIKLDRSFVGFELKASYFDQAKLNLRNALSNKDDLFSQLEVGK